MPCDIAKPCYHSAVKSVLISKNSLTLNSVFCSHLLCRSNRIICRISKLEFVVYRVGLSSDVGHVHLAGSAVFLEPSL
uniref:Uncharacterized protein n=1 Tax=Physcomitrium patens TaxID=3218 RepID=A0A7I3ZQM9_PHYPA